MADNVTPRKSSGGTGSSNKLLHAHVTVGVRVRAFGPDEPRLLAVRMADRTCQVTTETSGSQRFTFDHCLWSNDVADEEMPYASQEEVFQQLGAPIVQRLAEGYNGCLIAYGPTGSGKTYSLFGPSSPQSSSESEGTENLASSECDAGNLGIIPRVVQHVFATLKHRIERTTCSIVEIYMEDVYDLLQDSRAEVAIRQDPSSKTFFVSGATESEVESFEDMQALLRESARRKTVQATAKNIRSSRAHTIVQLSFVLTNPDVTVRLAFADLAGSERVKEAMSEGVTLEQAKHINLSLLSLGKCVEAAARASGPSDGLHDLNFRDSALTKVLKEYIAGNTLTTLLVTIAPGAKDVHHTLHALRFGDRAKHITHHASINTTLPEAVAVANVLQGVGQVGNADMAMGDGGRVYLFRQTKEYVAAQFSIRMLSLQKREYHIRAAYILQEQQAFTSFRRYVQREIARARAHAAKQELKKLPVLMRLRRAMAITEANHDPQTSSSAPPALLDAKGHVHLPAIHGRHRARGGGDLQPTPQRALSLEPRKSSDPRPPELPAIHPNRVRRNQAKGPAMPTLHPQALHQPQSTDSTPFSTPRTSKDQGRRRHPPASSTPRRSKSSDNDGESKKKPDLSPRPPSTPPSDNKNATHSVSPAARRSNSARKGSALERRMTVTDSDILRKDIHASKQAQLIAERQFFAEEYMKRVVLETDQHTKWKKFLKDVQGTCPEHGTAAKTEALEEHRKSSRMLLSRRGSVAASERQANTSPSSRDTSPAITPKSSRTNIKSPMPPSPVPPSSASRHPSNVAIASRSPTFHQVPVAAVLESVESPGASDEGPSFDSSTDTVGEQGWRLGRGGGSNINRVQSARRVRTNADDNDQRQPDASVDAEVSTHTTTASSTSGSSSSGGHTGTSSHGPRIPTPPSSTRPVPRVSVVQDPIVVENSECIARSRLEEEAETGFKALMTKNAIHAARTIDQMPASHIHANPAASASLPTQLVRLVTEECCAPINKREQTRHFNLLDFPEAVLPMNQVSWTWLVQYVEYASRLILWTVEELDAACLRSRCVDSSPFSSEEERDYQELLRRIQAEGACLQTDLNRGLHLLRVMLVSPEHALEASLDPSDATHGGILLPTGSSGVLGHRVSLGGESTSRNRTRHVSFCGEDSYTEEADGSSVALESRTMEMMPGIDRVSSVFSKSVDAVPTERAISPVSTTPTSSPRSPASSRSSSPRSSLSPTPELSARTASNVSESSALTSATTSAARADVSGNDPRDSPLYATVQLSATPVDRYNVMEDIARIDQLRSGITRQNSRGTFTDQELLSVSNQEQTISAIKQQMAAKIGKESMLVVVTENDADADDEALTTFRDFFGDLIFSTDIDPANLALVRSIIDAWRQQRIVVGASPCTGSSGDAVDLIQLSEGRGLIAAACADGSLGYLRSLLNLYRMPPVHGSEGSPPPLQDTSLDFNEICCSAMFNQLHRIPLVLVLLDYVVLHAALYPTLHAGFVEAAQEMGHEWNEFLSDICSAKKAIPKENRTGRDALVAALVQVPHAVIPLDMFDEGADDNTRLSRAANDGDIALLQTLAEHLPADTLGRLVLHKNPDGSNALIHAVLGGHADAVQFMCKRLRDCAASGERDAVKEYLAQRYEAGNAVELVKLLNRDPSMAVEIDALMSAL